MRRAPRLRLLSAVLALAAAASVGSTHPARAQEPDPAEYLDRLAGAEGATYHARQVVVLFEGDRSAAVVDVRSSPQATFLRAQSGSDVTRVWRRPGRGIVAAPRGALRDDSAPNLPLSTREILNKYEVTVGDPEDLLGIEVVALTLVRRSDRVTVERLWVHTASGVTYRRELYGSDGALVGMSAVIDMWWGREWTAEPFDAVSDAPTMVGRTTASDAPTRLPDGYRLVGASTLRAGGRPAEHWIYSDGLHALSIFRMSGPMRPPAGFRQVDTEGAKVWGGPGPGTWAWEGDGRTWVVVAEEAALDPAELTASLPRGGRSVWSRMGSLWARGFGALWGLFT